MLPFQGSQHSFIFDMDQVRVSTSNASVTMAPYALPVCMTQHHIPVCTGAHIPVHTAQPTWSFPPCSVHIPACSMQHLPACISHQVPLAHAIPSHMVAPPPPPPPPHFHHHQHHHHHQSGPSIQLQQQQQQQQPPHHPANSYQSHPHHHHHQPSSSQPPHPPPPPPPPPLQQHHHHIVSQNHVTPTARFVSAMPTLHRVQEDMLTEHRLPYLNIPHIASQPRTRLSQQPQQPPPILVQDHIVHAVPHEFFGTFQRYRRASSTRQRWRTIHPPPPPYPGFLLHFLAMLGRPPLTHYRMSLHNLHEDGTELDNYEALLNLADRLGEAKPRGLTKYDIDLLPCYRFNQETRRSLLDQTSCVICMSDFENRQLLRALPCFHEFHAKCVDKWLKVNRTCPICRADAAERAKAETE